MKAETIYVKRHQGEVYIKLRLTDNIKRAFESTEDAPAHSLDDSAKTYRILCRAKATGAVVPVRVYLIGRSRNSRDYLAVLPLCKSMVVLVCEMVDSSGWVMSSYKQTIDGQTDKLLKKLFHNAADDSDFVDETPPRGNPGGDSIEVLGYEVKDGRGIARARYHSLERRIEQRHDGELSFWLNNAQLETIPSKLNIVREETDGIERTVEFSLTFDSPDGDLFIFAADDGIIIPNAYASLVVA